MARLNNALAGGEGDPEELARILWKYARGGKPLAISEILDRVCACSLLSCQAPQERYRLQVLLDVI